MKILLAVLSLVFVSCSMHNKGGQDDISLTFLKHGKKSVMAHKVSLDKWRKDFNEMQRKNILSMMGLVSFSNGQKMMVINKDFCYRGPASELVTKFFGETPIAGYEYMANTYAQGNTADIRMRFKSKDDGEVMRVHVQNCTQDRGSEIDSDAVANNWDITAPMPKTRKIAQTEKPVELYHPPKVPMRGTKPSGFTFMYKISAKDRALLRRKNVKIWRPRYDFDKARMKRDDFPWRGKGLDIKKYKDALKFALLMQKYVYEGFVDDKNQQKQFDPWTNKKRYWCHTPWLNSGVKGREIMHGLTREFPIEHSKVYPSYTKDLTFFERPVSWGGAYFNAPMCKVYKDIFGTARRPLMPPRWDKSNFPHGSVSFKLLFNSVLDSKTKKLVIPEVKDAYAWATHTGVRYDKREPRKLRKMYHIQMDISFKDRALRGTNSDLNHWGMITYYYDKDYKGPKEYFPNEKVESPYDIKGLPEGLKKMRPVGVQFGMGAGESIIFKNSHNNHELADNEKGLIRDGRTRLNGPADNPKSSCLSCHGAAGTDTKIPPGMMANGEFVRTSAAQGDFDFNMQVDLAKKYYESVMEEFVNSKSKRR